MQGYGFVLDVVAHIKISNIHMFHSFHAGMSPILLEKHGAHVVLIQHGVLDADPLILLEVLRPQDLG